MILKMHDAFRIDIRNKVVCHSGIVLSTAHNIWNKILDQSNIYKKCLTIPQKKEIRSR